MCGTTVVCVCPRTYGQYLWDESIIRMIHSITIVGRVWYDASC